MNKDKIFVMRQLIKGCEENKKNVHGRVEVSRKYNRVYKEDLWRVFGLEMYSINSKLLDAVKFLL